MIHRSLIVSTLASAAALAWGAAANAHVVFDQTAATAGGYHAGFLRVSHGCAGSPTVALTVEIPDGVTIARPQPKPGWTLQIARAPLAVPIRSEGGEEVRERVASITWRGRLPADEFEQFGLMMKLPAAEGPLYFPAIQTCETGEVRWTDIPAPGRPWGSVPHPAPVLDLVPSDAHAGHGHAP